MQLKSTLPTILVADSPKPWDHGFMTYAFTFLVFLVAGLIIRSFWFSNKVKKKNARRRAEAVRLNKEERLRKCKPFTPQLTSNEAVGGHECSTQPATDDWLKILNARQELAPGNPFLADNMTQRALFMRKNANDSYLIKEAMKDAKISSPFELHKKEQVKPRVTCGYTSNNKAAVPHTPTPDIGNTVVNTIIALSIVDSLSSESNTNSSNSDTFSGGGGGGGGEFEGAVSSGSWDSSSSDSGYDSGGGFDSGSSGSFGSD